MIFVAMKTYDDIGMVTTNAKKLAQYAESARIFEMGGRIEVWEREKRKATIDNLREFVRMVRPDRDDDERKYGGFW